MTDVSTSVAPDAQLLLEMAKTLGSEPTLERLIERLMRTFMRAVSADRAVLVLDGTAPVVRATAAADGDVVLNSTPLSECVDVPGKILAQVLRHGLLVVCKDAIHDPQWATDPYVARVGVRSWLAVPLRRQEHSTGILYLENHSNADGFAPEQVETFRLLSPLVAMALDMTEMRAVEERLERSLSLLQATVEATADGILVVDRTGKVTLNNQRLLALWNFSAQELEGADERAILDAMLARVEDPDGFCAGVLELQDQPEREHMDIIRLRDGRTYERYTRPQRIGDAMIGRVWSYRDFSERERLLRRAIFLADATRLLVSIDVERALDAVVQLMVPDLAERCVIDLLDEGSLAVARDPSDSTDPTALEVHPRVLEGQPILYQLHSTSCIGVPIGVRGRLVGAMTLAAGPDREYTQTDLELAEELGSRIALCIDNARLHHQAKEALRTRDEFLSIASHEIRGPITSLHLAVQMLRGGQISPEAHAPVLELMEREGRRLSDLVDELLDVGRIRAGTLGLEFEDDVDLGDIVRSVASRLELELERAGSTITLAIEGQVHGVWDRLRLDQIVTNLLSNAIKFGMGKPIRVSVSTRNDFAVLIVSDQGMGMAADLQARIFRPFERGVPVRHYGGLGLGLYIVKTLVDGLGGHISAESTLGAGSKFTVELPRVRMPDAKHTINFRH